MIRDRGCELYVPRRNPERAASILRQGGSWHRGGPLTTRIGDIVHYVSYGTPGGEYPSTCRAAVVTEIGEGDTRGLAVLNPTGVFFNREIPYDSPLGGDLQSRHHRTPVGGTWHGMDECNPDGATLSRLWSGDSSGIGPVFR